MRYDVIGFKTLNNNIRYKLVKYRNHVFNI